MRARTKKGVALVMALCLATGLLPEQQIMPERRVRAAEQEKVLSDNPVVKQNDKQEQLRGAAEESTAVQFSKASGTYSEEFTLDLTCADTGAKIYYTTDGSDPSDAANEVRQLYTQGSITVRDRAGDPNVLAAIDPILYDAVNVTTSKDKKSFVSTLEKPSDEDVDKCTVIKAAAQYADGTCSEVVTNTYFIGEMADHIEGIRESCEAAGMDLSVMSISMDAEDLFDSQKGIYVKGDAFDKALEDYLKENGKISGDVATICRGLDANYKQKGREWERETHIDYFESDGSTTTCKLQQDCGVRIQGNYSRSDYQKSFRLFARADYGQKNFKYGFWDNALDDSGNVIEKYKKIVLRNGGNCAFTTKFSDAYWQSLMKDIDCDKQSARPCVVYLNGEYWGVYILQDDFCGAYFENKHGLDKDSILIYKGDAEANRTLGYKLDEGELPEGVTNENYYFEELEAFMSTHNDLSDAKDYEAFCQLVDKESAMDYFAAEVWINNKWDWPGKNWSMWKSTIKDADNPYADGKWRFLIYDVEFGGISGEQDINANTVSASNLLSTGTAEKGDANWDKPNVRCFALLMTNEGFREEFKARLTSFSDTIFKRETALAVANRFKDVYQPILDQFFNRFPTLWNGNKRTAEMAIYGNGWDTYGTWANIETFVGKRAEYIGNITKWIDKKYTAKPTPTPTGQTASPSPSPTASNTPAPAPTGASLEIPLCDGAKKFVKTDANGKVLSTKYKVEGITYALLSDGTFMFSKDNHSLLKKKTSFVVPDVVIAGGNKYKVTQIEAEAFRGAKKLKSVTIGEWVKKIGKQAFYQCKKLKCITFIGKKVKTIEKQAFQGIPKKAKLVCPKSKKKAYKKLMKKSGINLKKSKLKVVPITQKNQKKAVKTSVASQSGSASREAAAKQSRKQAEVTVTMSSLVKAGGGFQNAKSGTTVTISSAEELKLLSEYTNADCRTKGITFRQTAEINAADIEMEPIGMREAVTDVDDEEDEDEDEYYFEDHSFCGVYDGGGHAIRNLTISVRESKLKAYYLGMFAMVEDGELHNINLESIRFIDAQTNEEFTMTDEMDITMAGIAAFIEGEAALVKGCSNHADLSAHGEYVQLSGVVAKSYDAKVLDCHNDGKIRATGDDVDAAGIIYAVWSNLEGCTNQGEIYSDGYAAGITCLKTDEGDLRNCENTGKITGAEKAAGIVCSIYNYWMGSSRLVDCINSGEVHGKTAAGIVASLNCTMMNCENIGAIRGTDYAGGLVFAVEGEQGEVYASKNRGDVIGGTLAGGIAAQVFQGEISNVENFGSVTAEEAAGGIAGYAGDSKLGNLWNHGVVSGTTHVGGIVGSSDLALRIYEDYDDEEETITEEDIKGNCLGNCIHLGSVSGGSLNGAVIGYSTPKDKISHCYYLEGSAAQVSGKDGEITAKVLAADTWKQQSFLEELNQNISALPDMLLLSMQYDAAATLQWQSQILLRVKLDYGGTISQEMLDKQNIRFVAKNMESGEVFPLSGRNALYSFSQQDGVEYGFYRVMPDGTEKVIQEHVKLGSGESVCVMTIIFSQVRFYTDATWHVDDDVYEDYVGSELYTALYYEDPRELSFPKDPTRKGYEFGGWYTTGAVVNEERYALMREKEIEWYQQYSEYLDEWWEEDSDYLLDDYESKEDYISSRLKENFLYDNLEDYIAHFDEAFDYRYKVTELYEQNEWDDEEEYDVIAYSIYAKWTKKEENPEGPKVTEPPKKQIDISKYQDKEGNYVQKKGLIYKVNRKKKTATVVGVTSKALTSATIVTKVKTGGKSYKVTGITKKAFKGCYQLKKVKAKGKSLKKVKKKALKLIRKNR